MRSILRHFSVSVVLGLALGFALVASVSFAFTPPAQAPPGGNASAPLNTGATGQEKIGGLILNTGGAQYGLIVDKGLVGIGTPTPTVALDVAGTVAADFFTGDISQTTGSGTLWMYARGTAQLFSNLNCSGGLGPIEGSPTVFSDDGSLTASLLPHQSYFVIGTSCVNGTLEAYQYSCASGYTRNEFTWPNPAGGTYRLNSCTTS